MPATSAVEELAAILLVLRPAMLATGTVEKLAVLVTILLVLRLAMPVPPCQPCRLLLAGYSLPAMLDTLCWPCWLLLAGHASYFLPVMLVTLLAILVTLC